jgi:hypothetical protein
VESLSLREQAAGLTTHAFYEGFQRRAVKAKDDLWTFLLTAKLEGKTVAGYGAAAKGNTLINYSGIRADMIPYVVDKNPAKQGKFLPGSRIPIVSVNRIQTTHPDYILVLPWNIRDEVIADLSYVRDWGARFVSAIPELCIE